MAVHSIDDRVAQLLAMLQTRNSAREAENQAVIAAGPGPGNPNDDDDDTDGTDGDDLLDFTTSPDNLNIDARDGDDTVIGGFGDDDIDGGDGNDSLLGGEGGDKIKGRDGDDFIAGDGGNDDLDGGKGNDTILGGLGDDDIKGGKGDNAIHAGDGNDKVTTKEGDDVVLGGGGEDTIKSGKGDDFVSGDEGNDDIDAGKGDDTVDGGEGNDTIDGGEGYDTALFDGSILDFIVSSDPGGSNDDDDDDDGETVTVSDQNPGDGDEGTDTLTEVEALQFDDYTLLLDGTNNAPLIVAADQVTDEDTATAFTAAVYDFDGDTISVDAVTFSGAGSFAMTTSPLVPLFGSGVQLNFSFDPSGAYDTLGVGDTAVETVTVDVSDGNGGVHSLTFDITINGVNDPPVAADDTAMTDEDTPVTFDVLGNDTDIEGDTLTVTGAVADNGTVVVNPDGTLTYTPDLNFFGVDMISYSIGDGNGGMDMAVVTVTVNPVNDAPDTTAPDDPSETVNEADGPASINLNPRVSDVDGDNLTITFARFLDPETGTRFPVVVTLVNGVASFDPSQFGLGDGQVLDVQLLYTVMDDSGEPNDTSTGLVDVTINGADVVTPPANQAPTADPLDLTGGPNVDEAAGDITFDLAPVTDDPDGDPLTVVALIGPGGVEVSFTQIGETIVVDPQQFGLDLGQSDLIELTYTVDDGSGAPNSQATSTIRFNLDGAVDDPPPPPTNTPPLANDVSRDANEEDGAITIDLTTEVSDADGDNLTVLGVRLITAGVTVDFGFENGVLTIDPESLGLDTGQMQTLQFEYDVEDDSGQSNSLSTGNITVNIDGFTEGDPPPPTAVTLDFEPFAAEDGFALDITAGTYEGFSFSGSAIVIETDEAGGGGRDPGGIVTGQTTTGGDNVLVGTFSTIEVPVLDQNGDPVIDPVTREPVTQTVVDEPFGIFGPGATFDLTDLGPSLGFGISGNPPPIPTILPDGVGDSFSLDGLSLNLPDGTAAVTITLYGLGVAEVAGSGGSSYFLEYAAVDSFVFNIDGNTPATELDFNDPATLDAFGAAIDTASFDDIYAIGIETDNGSAVVLDDILISL